VISRDTVMFALACRIGQASGVRARDLVTEICGETSGALERQLRAVIEELRLEGRPICGHPSTGYFIASNQEELQRTADFLRNRAAKSFTQAARMLGVSVPELAGQLRLPS
jgi:hypothetical protein